MMPPALRPVAPTKPRLRLPDRNWSPEERRFLEAAIQYVDVMRGRHLDKEAERMEREMKED